MKKEKFIEELKDLDSVYLYDYDGRFELSMCSYSDYSGGLIEQTNQKVFMENYSFLSTVRGGAGTVAAIVDPEDLPEESGDFDQFLEDYTSLEGYPCIDDDVWSELKVQAEIEAWASWVSQDFEGYLEDKIGEPLEDLVERFVEEHEVKIDYDEFLSKLFEYARMKTNLYYQEETGGGIYIDVDKVGEGIGEHTIEAMLWQEKMEQLELLGQQRLFERGGN